MYSTVAAVLRSKTTDVLLMLMTLRGEPINAPPKVTALLLMKFMGPVARMVASSTYTAPAKVHMYVMYACVYICECIHVCMLTSSI